MIKVYGNEVAATAADRSDRLGRLCTVGGEDVVEERTIAIASPWWQSAGRAELEKKKEKGYPNEFHRTRTRGWKNLGCGRR